MYDPYDTAIRLSEEALRTCERHWLDPDDACEEDDNDSG